MLDFKEEKNVTSRNEIRWKCDQLKYEIIAHQEITKNGLRLFEYVKKRKLETIVRKVNYMIFLVPWKGRGD